MPRANFSFLDPERIEAGLPSRLRELATDVEQIVARSGPSPELLEAAPLLQQWRYTLTPIGVRLEGLVAGHPKLQGGRIVTSPLWVVDPQLRWARTTNRYYRLGTRAENQVDDDTDQEEILR